MGKFNQADKPFQKNKKQFGSNNEKGSEGRIKKEFKKHEKVPFAKG